MDIVEKFITEQVIACVWEYKDGFQVSLLGELLLVYIIIAMYQGLL